MKLDYALNRLAFALIATLVVLAILSAIIPQQGFAEEQVLNWKELLGDKYVVIETLGLDRIYFTPLFFVVLGLLGVTLAVGNIRRFRLVYRVERTLLKARHLGSIIFHLSLLLIMTGVILNYLFKFNGVFALTEGQSVNDEEGMYFRLFEGPVRSADFERFRLKLDTVYDAYPVEDAVTEAAEISLRDWSHSDTVTTVVRTNKPLHWNELSFHYGLLAGYSPELSFWDSTGERLFRGFVRLATRKAGEDRTYSDFVVLPGKDMTVRMTVRPEEPRPFLITVEEGELTVFEGHLSESDTARFEHYGLAIPRLRRWCYIDVVANPFLSLVFTGFWTGLAGLGVTFASRLGGWR